MNVSGTMNSATGHTSVSTRTGNFSDGLYDEAGARPDLDLDFARTKSLKDKVSKEELITFTRGTTRTRGATYVDENGLVKRAGHNLLINSHNIGGTNWFLTTFSDGGATQSVTQNTTETTAPNGMFEASKLIIDTGTTAGRMICISTGAYQDGGPIQVNDFIIASVYLKSATGQNQLVNLSMSGSARSTVTITNEWQRFAIRAKRPTSAGSSAVGDYRLRIGLRNQAGSSGANQPDNDGNFSNLHAEFYAWGAQFEHDGTAGNNSGSAGYTGSIGELVKTTTQACGAPRFTHDPVTKESKGLLIEQQATNLLTDSEDFSGYNNYKSTVTTDQITAPDGTQTADKIQWINEGGNPIVFKAKPADGVYTISAFFKKGNSDGAIIYADNSAFRCAIFDLENGTTGPFHSTFSKSTIEDFGNGWFRCSATTVAISGSNLGFGVCEKEQTNTTVVIPSTTDSHNYIWGAQVEAGSLLTSYIPTSGGTATRSPDLASIEGDNFGTYRANMLNAVSSNLVLNNTGVTTTGVSVIENTLNMNVTAYSALAPDGTFSAVKMEDDDLGSTSAVRQISYRIGAEIATDKGNGPLLANTTYTVSGYFKAGTASKAAFWLAGTDWATPPTPQQWINLSDGSLLGSTSVQTANNATVTDAGNGWYRLSLTCTTGSSISNDIKLRVNSVNPTGTSTSLNFTGKAGSFYMWGLQIEQGTSVTPYIPSTDKYTNRQSNATFVDGNGIIRTSFANLAQYSEDFTNSEWIKDSTTVTANATIAPDGTNTASLLTATVGTTGNHRLRDTGNSLGPHRYTFSVFVKPNTTSHVGFQMYKTGIDTILFKRFKLDTETIFGSTGDAKITKYPNGWYRIQGTTAPDTNTANTSFVIVLYRDNSSDISYTGAGESVYIWGAQVVKHTEAVDYYKTTGTVDGPPRYSHDPETLTPTGLYLEAKTTNDARDTERLGASGSGMDTSDVYVAGPYTFSNSKRKTETGITNPDGSTDGTCVLTVNSGTHLRQQPRGFRLPNENSLSGRSVTSVFVKRKTSTARYVLLFMGGTGTYQQCMFDFDTETVVTTAAPHNLNESKQFNGSVDRLVERGVVEYPNGWYRLYMIVDTGGSSVIAGNGYGVGLANDPETSKATNATDDGPYDGTEAVYVWGLNRCSADDLDSSNVPQETNLSSYIKNSQVNASEVIRTPDNFTSEATEVLDRANGTKPAFYTTNGISIYAEAKYNASSHDNIANFSRILQLRQDTTNVVGLYKHNNQIQFIGPNDMFVQRGFNLGSGDLQIGTRYAKNDSRIYLNFNQSLTNTQGTLDTDVPAEEKATDLYIGNNAIGSGFTNGTIKRLTFWTTPLPDNKLDRITA